MRYQDLRGMRFLSAYVNAVDAADIAAYIANPAAANGSPASLSATSLTFAAQTIGTASAAQTVTVSNTGTATPTLSGLTPAGARPRTSLVQAAARSGPMSRPGQIA
jgi:hypothetical protein